LPLSITFTQYLLPTMSDYVSSAIAEVSNQMLELYEQNKSGTGSRLSDPTSSAGPTNRLKGIVAAQTTTDGIPSANGQSHLLPATVTTQSQELGTMSRFVDVHAGQREFTEARSSLEEGEDMAESKAALVETKPSKMITPSKAVPITKVETGDGGTAEVKLETVEESKPTWGSLDEVNTDKVKAAMEKRRRSRGGTVDACPTFDKGDPSDEEELLERELENGVEAAVKAATNTGRLDTNVEILNYKVKPEIGDAKEAVEEGELAMYETGILDTGGMHSRRSNIGEEDSWDMKREGFGEGQVGLSIERAEDKMVQGHGSEHEMVSVRMDVDSVAELDKVKKGVHNSSERGEIMEYASAAKHHRQIVSDVNNKGEHQQSDRAGRRDHTVKVVSHRVEHESADGKRKRPDSADAAAAAAAKRKRGVTGLEGHSIDRKVEPQEHGERAYMETATTKGSSGPVEDGELPSSNPGKISR
jgi:hypothetical protein